MRVNQTLPRKQYRPRTNSTPKDDHRESDTSLTITTSLEHWDEWFHPDVVTVDDADDDI